MSRIFKLRNSLRFASPKNISLKVVNQVRSCVVRTNVQKREVRPIRIDVCVVPILSISMRAQIFAMSLIVLESMCARKVRNKVF